MTLLFFPFLLLFILTGKKIFAIGIAVSIFFPVMGALFEGLGELFGALAENETVQKVGGIVAFLGGAICIYSLMFW